MVYKTANVVTAADYDDTHDSGNNSKAISKSPTDTKANTLFVDC